MQQFHQPQTHTKIAVLIFLKVVGPPLVLYVENPESLYNELKDIVKNASPQSPKLIEKAGVGPLKSIAILDSQIAGVAMQEETMVSY